jgi:uncharacterized membrane protein YdbT with pleckstrin-like domain
MSYVQKILQPDEHVVATGKKHWIIYGQAMVLLVLALVAIVVGPPLLGYAPAFQILAAILALLGLASFVRAWFDQWTTEIAVTNKRVIYKRGFISRYTTEMNMEKVESVVVDQNLWGRVFGYGTISARGTGVGIEHLTRIADPLRLRSAIVVR